MKKYEKFYGHKPRKNKTGSRQVLADHELKNQYGRIKNNDVGSISKKSTDGRFLRIIKSPSKEFYQKVMGKMRDGLEKRELVYHATKGWRDRMITE